jgi:hypothetical protein
MKREHTTTQSYIDWLKSIGCVLYLPLTQDGDLQDRISGASLQYTNSGTRAYWDNNEGMYVFVGPSYHTQSYTLANSWSAATFPDNEVSVLTTFKKKSANGNGTFMCVGNYTAIGNATMQAGTSNIASWNNSLYNCAYTLSSAGRWLYDNGALFATYGAYAPYLPQGWGGYNWYVGSYNSNNNGREVYIKETLMFNKVLDLQTIRKIQGYE